MLRMKSFVSTNLSVRKHALRQLSSSAKPAPVSLATNRIQLFSKSRIGDIFARYCPTLDPEPHHVAAQVFPMRVNNYVLENLIDWFVCVYNPEGGPVVNRRVLISFILGRKCLKIRFFSWYFPKLRCSLSKTLETFETLSLAQTQRGLACAA
jgi:hypothetical protein